IPKRVRRILVANKSVAYTQSRIVILDDFLDSTSRTGHGQRPILQTVHRAQATGFNPRRDQRYVGARLNQMSEGLVISPPISKLRGIFSGRDGERGFISWVAF